MNLIFIFHLLRKPSFSIPGFWDLILILKIHNNTTNGMVVNTLLNRFQTNLQADIFKLLLHMLTFYLLWCSYINLKTAIFNHLICLSFIFNFQNHCVSLSFAVIVAIFLNGSFMLLLCGYFLTTSRSFYSDKSAKILKFWQS